MAAAVNGSGSNTVVPFGTKVKMVGCDEYQSDDDEPAYYRQYSIKRKPPAKSTIKFSEVKMFESKHGNSENNKWQESEKIKQEIKEIGKKKNPPVEPFTMDLDGPQKPKTPIVSLYNKNDLGKLKKLIENYVHDPYAEPA